MKPDSQVLYSGRVLKGIIFDLDGTLTDSIRVFYEAFRRVTVAVGVNIRKEDIFGPLAEGTEPWDQAFPMDLPDRERTMREFRRVMKPAYVEATRRVRVLPGVAEVLARLRQHGIRLGVVTDSASSSLEPLRAQNLIEHFAAIVTRDDGFPRKPDSQGLRECLKRMEVDPEHAMIVGDTLMDIRVGKEVGVLTVGVLTGLANRSQLEAAEPTVLVENVTCIPDLLNLNELDG